MKRSLLRRSRLGWLALWCVAVLGSQQYFVPAGAARSTPAAVTPRGFLPVVTQPKPTGNPAPGSEQLIDQAVAKGAISAETGLVYKVYAVFGDARLPVQYRGNDRALEGTAIVTEATLKLPTLSAPAQALITPFLLAPNEAGSWYALRSQPSAQQNAQPDQANVGLALGAQSQYFKIWYEPRFPGDLGRAQRIANELEATIWPKLSGLMGRAPLPDCGGTCVSGGDDTRYDIYLADVGRSYVRPKAVCAGASTYMVLRRTASYATVAHELMHSIQFAFRCASYKEYSWLYEATAQWAMDYVYPGSNNDPDFRAEHEEHSVTRSVFADPLLPLETEDGKHEYGAYLFFFFLHRYQSNPTIVREIWEQAMMPNSLDVIDIATDGGFRKKWPLFALYNYNADPVDTYWQWDRMFDGADAQVSFIGAPETKPFSTRVPHLAASYLHFNLEDQAIKRIVVTNPIADVGSEDVTLWAIPMINGEWQAPEDWSAVRRKEYCRDLPAQNVQELVLIVANSQWQNRAAVFDAGNGTITTEKTCNTSADVTGTITYLKEGTTGWQNSRFVEQATINVRLRYDAETEQYVDAGSSYSYTGSGHQEVYANGTSIITDWTSSGGGAYNGESTRIVGSSSDDDSQFWVGANVEFKTTSTTVISPNGGTHTSSKIETLSPGCSREGAIDGTMTGLLQKPAPPYTYTMACTQRVGAPSDALNWRITMSGSLTVRNGAPLP